MLAVSACSSGTTSCRNDLFPLRVFWDEVRVGIDLLDGRGRFCLDEIGGGNVREEGLSLRIVGNRILSSAGYVMGVVGAEETVE